MRGCHASSMLRQKSDWRERLLPPHAFASPTPRLGAQHTPPTSLTPSSSPAHTRSPPPVCSPRMAAHGAASYGASRGRPNEGTSLRARTALRRPALSGSSAPASSKEVVEAGSVSRSSVRSCSLHSSDESTMEPCACSTALAMEGRPRTSLVAAPGARSCCCSNCAHSSAERQGKPSLLALLTVTCNESSLKEARMTMVPSRPYLRAFISASSTTRRSTPSSTESARTAGSASTTPPLPSVLSSTSSTLVGVRTDT
mmetsp:Transcript_3772/g.7272  ORF Transcript_3772/g.7272 Transcript_3772/m.7272 type:complete len:256 (+) Transcript_3772:1125-1892(+)